MFGASLVWLLVYAYPQGGAAPLGTFATKEACIKATSEAYVEYQGKAAIANASNFLFCVPVEKPIGK